MDHESHDRKRVSGTCDTLCNASIARSIRRDAAASPRGFSENVPIIQRKSLYAVMGSHYRADGARWCSGRRAYRVWCVFRVELFAYQYTCVRIHTYIQETMLLQARLCMPDTLTLICRGNTQKIAKTFCWRAHYWSDEIDRITRNAVKVNWSGVALCASGFITAGSAALDQKETSRTRAPDDSADTYFRMHPRRVKKNGYFDIRLIAVVELTAKTAVFCGRFAFVV